MERDGVPDEERPLGETVRAAFAERERRELLARRRAEGAARARLFASVLSGPGTRTCALHGDYSFTHEKCPVCAGRSTGRTWSATTGRELPVSYFDRVERAQRLGDHCPSGPAEGDWNVRGWGE